MRIPIDELSEEALTGVVEAFVLREGTDYGHSEYSLQQKCRAVMRALRAGTAYLTYDPQSDSTSIVEAGYKE